METSEEMKTSSEQDALQRDRERGILLSLAALAMFLAIGPLSQFLFYEDAASGLSALFILTFIIPASLVCAYKGLRACRVLKRDHMDSSMMGLVAIFCVIDSLIVATYVFIAPLLCAYYAAYDTI